MIKKFLKMFIKEPTPLEKLKTKLESDTIIYSNVYRCPPDTFTFSDIIVTIAEFKHINSLDITTTTIPFDNNPIPTVDFKTWLTNDGRVISDLNDTIKIFLNEAIIISNTLTVLEKIQRPTPTQSFNIRKLKPYIINIEKIGGYLEESF